MVVPIATVYRIVSLIAIVFSIVNILFLFVLQCSRDPSLHTPFYRIFKVNVVYAVMNMLARTNFFIKCIPSVPAILLLDSTKTLSLLGYDIGLFYIELLRFSILRSNGMEEQSWSNWLLRMLFLMQFAVPTALTTISPDEQYSLIDDGCYIYEGVRKIAILRTICHAAFFLPSIVTMKLTVSKLREMRAKKNFSRTARRHQENLVKYTICCALMNIVQCTAIFLRMLVYKMEFPEAIRYMPLLINIMNLVYQNLSFILLIHYSTHVRKHLARFLLCNYVQAINVQPLVSISVNEPVKRKYVHPF